MIKRWKRFKKKYVCIDFDQFEWICVIFAIFFLIGFYYSVVLGTLLSLITLLIISSICVWYIREKKIIYKERLVIKELSRLRRKVHQTKSNLLIKMDNNAFKNFEKEVIKSNSKFDKIKMLKTLQRLIYIEGSYIEVSRTKIILHGIKTSEYNSSVIGIIYNTKETHQYLEKMSEMKLFKRKWFEYLKLITEISIEHYKVT